MRPITHPRRSKHVGARLWKTHSFWAGCWLGRRVRASVCSRGCLLRATWVSTGDLFTSLFLPLDYYHDKELWYILEVARTMLTRPTAPESGAASSGGFPDQSFETDYPVLYSYLCDTCYSDGTARKTATITMFVDGGYLKACVNDRDNARTAFVTGGTLVELLDSMEGLLCDNKTVWKLGRDEGGGQVKRERKKS